MIQKMLIIALFPTLVLSQNVIPFVDFNNYFRSFQEEGSTIVEFQKINEFKAGDEFVAYIDNRGNLRMYDGKEVTDITNLNIEYEVSDHLLAWKVGGTLNMWDNGKMQTLTYNGRDYAVKDSIIVYEDLRYNTVNVYWNGKITPLYTVIDELYMPVYIGENIVAFRDNGNFFKIFWNGSIYDVGVWNGVPIDFQGGTDVLAFNDPTHRTFTVFDRGEFTDVESFYMGKYRGGRGFVVYEDLNGNLNYYADGIKNPLSNFSAKMWMVKDDLVIWSENSFLYAYSKGEKTKVATYVPSDYELKNNVLAFRNIMGGVNVFANGAEYELTNQVDSHYSIYGNSVIVRLFNNAYIVWKNGVKYSF
jgi:hypothetical protein